MAAVLPVISTALGDRAAIATILMTSTYCWQY